MAVIYIGLIINQTAAVPNLLYKYSTLTVSYKSYHRDDSQNGARKWDIH